MAKLHELLAVEGNLKTQAEKTRTELMGTFEKKRHLFSKKVVTFTPNAESAPPVTEEQLDLQSTITAEINWITPFLQKALDASYQVAVANTTAKADIALEDGIVIATGVPATALLELEKRTKELHDFVAAIPTLDPAKGYKPDVDEGKSIYKAREDVRVRTKKTQSPLVLAPATDKHPAQVQLITEDIPTGLLKTQEWSGLITPSAKGILLEKVEDLSRAVKKARARANESEIDTRSNRIGQNLLSYVFSEYLS